MLALLAGATPALAQVPPTAEANQLHAAIENGDVEALGYWLAVRHADPNATSADQPDVTPLARCLGLAARVLDGPSPPRTPAPAGAATQAAPVFGLRVLQDMIVLLDRHGARLSDDDRRRFSAPVLRWYEDAVSRPAPATAGAAPGAPASVPAAPTAAPPDTPSAPTAPATPPPAPTPAQTARPASPPKPALVVIAPDERKTCNRVGHRVYLENGTLLTITATVTMYQDGKGRAKPRSSTDTYAVEQLGSYELGCDVSADGGRVRYELKGWK